MKRVILPFLTILLGAQPAAAQSALELELARDFLTLELAGWRLPDPDPECLRNAPLTRLEAGSYGASEMAVDPIAVEGPGPFYRGLAIEPHPTDRRRRIARFEWTVRDQGRARTLPDRFEFAVNPAGGGGDAGSGLATMMREPEWIVVRRECLNG